MDLLSDGHEANQPAEEEESTDQVFDQMEAHNSSNSKQNVPITKG